MHNGERIITMGRYAIVLSGGTGTRLGAGIPKQYLKVGDRRIIEYVLDTICRIEGLCGVAVVVADEWKEIVAEAAASRELRFVYATPGENRQLSVYQGLLALEELGIGEDDLVLVQDAARPKTGPELIEACFAPCETGGYDGAMPVLPMKDTVYMSTDGKSISSLIDRKTVWAGQAPEVFRYGLYRRANEALIVQTPEAPILRINGSSEPAVLAGMKIAMIPGDEENVKITTPADLRRFENEVRG